MKKQIIVASMLICSVSLVAQVKQKKLQDSIQIHEIEDINLHKTGNPNKAKIFSAKSKLSVMENPQPIAIVTHEIIEQQQVKQLSEVMQNVNGIYLTSSRGASQDSFGGRGFIFGSDNIFKNGARVNSGVFPEVSGIERVEVLKGSNALLYGNVAPGGLVNIITKKPRFENGGSIAMNAGSWDTYKPTVDIFGPLTKNIAYRINGAFEMANSFRDVVSSKKHYFNPSFAFNLSDRTQIIVEADYLKHDFTPDFGIGSVVDAKTGISTLNTKLKRSDFVGANWQYQNVQQTTTDIILNHQFNKKWSLNAVAAYQNYTKDYFSTERVQWTFDSSKPNDRISWKRPLGKNYTEQNYASLQINLNGEFNLGTVKNKILVGTDGDYNVGDVYEFANRNNVLLNRTTYYNTNGSSSGALYLDDPSTWASGAMPESKLANKTRHKTTRYGVFIQDFVEISEQFKLLAGLRYSYLKNEDTEKKDFLKGTETQLANSGTHFNAFSPKASLIYTPNTNLSFFATYTNSFIPNTGFDVNSNPLKPSIADQYEIGIKHNFYNKTLAVNLSLYQIHNKNTYISPFNASGKTEVYKVFAGELKSQGIELDITGNPTPNLNIIAGASYNHTAYTNTPDNGFVENQRVVRTPAFTANASVFYKFNGTLKGLIVGGRAFYTGDRKAGWNDVKGQSQISRMLDVKAFTTFDLSLGYEYKKLLFQAKMGNLFDEINYNVHENYSVNPITPRNVYFTLTYKL